jgi:MFS family permease
MNDQDLHSIQKRLETKKRVFFGALSGFIAGTIAALVSSFINTWVFPDLPLYLYWPAIFYAWVLWAILGGMLAGLSAFSAEGWASVLLSAVGMAFTILLLNIMQSSEGTLLKAVSLFGLLFPVAAMMSPLAFIFFWLARRFVGIVSATGWTRIKVILVNTIVILVIGVIPGAYARMNENTEKAVRIIHGMLQDAAKASSSEALNKAFAKTEGFAEHKGQPYALSQSPSVYSTVGVDVIAHYEDGYTIVCTVVMYPGNDPSIYPCKGQLP